MPELSLIAALAGGLVILAMAGDFLVDGAVSLARRGGFSPLVAGIFIVGFGTSAPEMLVAVQASMGGHPELAMGNIVGSNIANVWLVLGLPALIAPLATGQYGERRALVAMLLATVAWILVTGVGRLHAGVGFAFILGLFAYAFYTFHATARAKRAGLIAGIEVAEDEMRLGKALIYTVVGIFGLPLGAHLIIEGGVGIARVYDVPEEVIGLTLLAVGTSLPEMGAGIAAALRGRGEVLIGNILGSNIFNILGAGGLVAFFGPVVTAETFLRYDHWAMAAAALTAAAFIAFGSRITRLSGALLLLVYAAYIYGLVQGWNVLALFTGGGGGG